MSHSLLFMVELIDAQGKHLGGPLAQIDGGRPSVRTCLELGEKHGAFTVNLLKDGPAGFECVRTWQRNGKAWKSLPAQ